MKNTPIKILTILTFVLWTGILATVLAYRFDGQFFPVVSDLKISAATIRPYYGRRGGWSFIGGEFEKYRGRCVFQGIEWYFTDNREIRRSQGVQVAANFEDKPQVRLGGKQDFTNLAVRLSEKEDIFKHSYIEVIHDCYNGWLWQTRTRQEIKQVPNEELRDLIDRIRESNSSR